MTVLAILDSGVNPYHQSFAEPAATAVTAAHLASRLGTAELNLSKAEKLQDAIAQDNAIWSAIQPKTLYYLAATRLLAISFPSKSLSGPASPIQGPDGAHILDATGHGTTVAGTAALAGPHVVLLIVQVPVLTCPEKGEANCILDPAIAEAMEWVSNQSWIDVVSYSLGFLGNPPEPSATSDTAMRFAEATRMASARAKLVVDAAGNSATPTLLDPFSGPPWLITVGAYDATTRGTTLDASKGVDVAANYTSMAPSFDSRTAYHPAHGTSVAAPRVAGILAEVIAALNERPTKTTSLRDALNASVYEVLPTEWRPSASPPSLENSSVIAVPASSSAELGWGIVDDSTIPAMIARASGTATPAPHSPTTQAMQDRYQASRLAYWGQALSAEKQSKS